MFTYLHFLFNMILLLISNGKTMSLLLPLRAVVFRVTSCISQYLNDQYCLDKFYYSNSIIAMLYVYNSTSTCVYDDCTTIECTIHQSKGWYADDLLLTLHYILIVITSVWPHLEWLRSSINSKGFSFSTKNIFCPQHILSIIII